MNPFNLINRAIERTKAAILPKPASAPEVTPPLLKLPAIESTAMYYVITPRPQAQEARVDVFDKLAEAEAYAAMQAKHDGRAVVICRIVGTAARVARTLQTTKYSEPNRTIEKTRSAS